MTKFCQLLYSWRYSSGLDIFYSGCHRPISHHYDYSLGPSHSDDGNCQIRLYVIPLSLVFVTSAFVGLKVGSRVHNTLLAFRSGMRQSGNDNVFVDYEFSFMKIQTRQTISWKKTQKSAFVCK